MPVQPMNFVERVMVTLQGVGMKIEDQCAPVGSQTNKVAPIGRPFSQNAKSLWQKMSLFASHTVVNADPFSETPQLAKSSPPG